MNGRTIALLLAGSLLGATSAYGPPVSAAQFAVDWAVLSGGGGQMTSASYRLNGTLGQGFAGYASSANYQHWIGFWIDAGAAPQPVHVSNLDEAKTLADGTPVLADGLCATTAAGAFGSTVVAYVEQPDRASGMRVVLNAPAGWLTVGARVSVAGVMATSADDERQIASATLTPESGTLALLPLHATNKSLGGAKLGNPPLGQHGVTGGAGVNTVGLLMMTWGRVINDPSEGYTMLDDGSGTPVRMETGHLSILWSSGDYLKVKGLSSLRKTGSGHDRVIIPRDNADISGG